MEEAKKEESTEFIEKRHEESVHKAGQIQFTKALAEAELLQLNQQILNDRTELQKRHQAATGKPKIVVPDEVQTPEGEPIQGTIKTHDD